MERNTVRAKCLPQGCPHPGLLDPETSTITTRPPYLPNKYVTNLKTLYCLSDQCTENHKLWPDPIISACPEYLFIFLSQSDLSDLTESPWIVDFQCLTSPEVTMLTADQQKCSQECWRQEHVPPTTPFPELFSPHCKTWKAITIKSVAYCMSRIYTPQQYIHIPLMALAKDFSHAYILISLMQFKISFIMRTCKVKQQKLRKLSKHTGDPWEYHTSAFFSLV